MNFRNLLFVIGCTLLIGACVAALRQMTWLSIDFGIPGLVLVAGIVFERWRYKPVLREPPGDEWQPTGERFIDSETGRLVEVYRDATGGNRVYVTSDRPSKIKENR